MFRSRFCRTAVSMLAAALFGVLTVVGCSDDDDNGGGNGNGGDYDPSVIGSHGYRVVGDWWEDGIVLNNAYDILSLKPSGDFCWSFYEKVDDFWVGGEECEGTWRADNRYIYIDEDGDEWRVEYSVSGNTMIWTSCDYDDYDDEEYCWDAEFPRANNNKPSGTIRSNDTALYGTEWRMESSNLYFSMGSVNVSSSAGYFSTYYESDAWYVSGNRLYMLGLEVLENTCRNEYDCAYTIAEQIEFTYTHVPGVSLRLRNTELDIDDTWEYGSFWKRRDETDTRQSPFRRPQPRRALSKR